MSGYLWMLLAMVIGIPMGAWLLGKAVDRIAACTRPNHPPRPVVRNIPSTAFYRVRGEGGLARCKPARLWMTAEELRRAPRLLLGELWVEAER